MDNGPKDMDAERRIAELEQEVRRLRDQVGDDVPCVDDGEPITDADMPYMPSRTRAIVIPVFIGLAVMAAMLAMTGLLSSGLDSFARKAASALVPDDVAEQSGTPASASPTRPPVKLAPIEAPAPAQPPPIRAPGL